MARRQYRLGRERAIEFHQIVRERSFDQFESTSTRSVSVISLASCSAAGKPVAQRPHCLHGQPLFVEDDLLAGLPSETLLWH
jgi:hypothetical protein